MNDNEKYLRDNSGKAYYFTDFFNCETCLHCEIKSTQEGEFRYCALKQISGEIGATFEKELCQDYTAKI